MNLPPIPMNSKYFRELFYNGKHEGWMFDLRFDCKRRSVCLEWIADSQRIPHWSSSDEADIEQFRSIIAAVAAAEWRKVATPMMCEFDDDDYDECLNKQETALKNALAWEAWGGWK